MRYDLIIRDGLWFDGTGAEPRPAHLGIIGDRVATVAGEPLDEAGCPEVIDARGKWVLPGFVDIHTHYDAEIPLIMHQALSALPIPPVTSTRTGTVGACSSAGMRQSRVLPDP